MTHFPIVTAHHESEWNKIQRRWTNPHWSAAVTGQLVNGAYISVEGLPTEKDAIQALVQKLRDIGCQGAAYILPKN